MPIPSDSADTQHRPPSISAGAKTEALGLLSFVRKPTQKCPAPDRPVVAWASLLAISMALTLLVSLPLVLLAAQVYEPTAIDELEMGNWELILLGVVAAPLLEEPAFRLWLSPRRRTTLIGLTFAALFTALLVADLGPLSLIGLASGGIFLLGAIAAVIDNRQHAVSFDDRHVPFIVWASVLAFALFHLTNLDQAAYDFSYWWLLPVWVIPQFQAGIVYCYIRSRLGFWAACAIHAAENFLLIVPVLAFEAM